MRILVTGSRDWDSVADVFRLIETQVQIGNPDNQEVTIVHGDCPTGADNMAKQWVKIVSSFAQYPVVEEAHPASWKEFGRAAGPIRNKEMVDLGADVCLAFIRNNSKGASMTANLAEKAGIKLILVKVNDQ